MKCPITCEVKIEDGRSWVVFPLPEGDVYIKIDDETNQFIMEHSNSTRYKFKAYIGADMWLHIDYVDEVTKTTYNLVSVPPA